MQRTQYRADNDTAVWRNWVQDMAALLSLGAFALAALSWGAIAQTVMGG